METKMLTSSSASITRKLIGFSLLAAIALSPVQAYARINGAVFDSFSLECLALQNKGDRLRAEYRNASNARREEILAELRSNGMTWIQIGCRGVFGDISKHVVLPQGDVTDVGGMSLSGPSDGGGSSGAPAISTPSTTPSFL